MRAGLESLVRTQAVKLRMQMASRRLPCFLILAVAAAISVDAGGNDALIKRNTAGTVTIG